MRVYHFTSAKHAINDIRFRHLKVATLEDVNDPFELAVCCDDPVRRQALRATRREWAKRIGLLCFSRGWHNPVQRSHYGDKHRGICLGFDVPDDLLLQVQYAEEPPQLDWDAIEALGPAGETEMLRWSTTKFNHWAYEAEFRLFLRRTMDNPQFEHFGSSLRLREVIVGPESDVSRPEIVEALGDIADIKAFKTRLAFEGYRVVTQRDPARW
ncbi:MAG: DUF2971 domain-containing protein [Aureliella sp.]